MKKVKRLFMVKEKDSFIYFDNKMEAKKVRDEKRKMGQTTTHISKGPNHPLFGIKKASSIHPKRKRIK